MTNYNPDFVLTETYDENEFDRLETSDLKKKNSEV